MKIKNYPAVTAAIQTKVGNRPCIACGKMKGFYIQDNEFQDMGFNRAPEGISLTGEHSFIPCLAVVCSHCGFTMKYHLGILLDDPDYLKK